MRALAVTSSLGDVFPGATPVAAATFIQDQRTLWAEVVRERKISVG